MGKGQKNYNAVNRGFFALSNRDLTLVFFLTSYKHLIIYLPQQYSIGE